MSTARPAYSFIHNILTHLSVTVLLSSIFNKALYYQMPKRHIFSQTRLRAQHTPEKKEIVFFLHGWQRAPVALKWGPDQDLAKAAAVAPEFVFKELSWREQAYSYDVRHAQHRIWTNADNFQDKLITEVYQVLQAHPKIPFRLVGHSLGCQVTLKLSQRLIEENPLNQNYWPGRIALLEPAFVRKLATGQSNDIDNSRDKCIKLLDQLTTSNVAIETYRSSVLTRNCFIGHSNQFLASAAPFPCIDINYPLSNYFNLQETHNGAKIFYFRTFRAAPHTICGTPMPYASSSTDIVRSSYGKHFEQIVGGAHGGMFMSTTKDKAPPKCPVKSLWEFFIPRKTETQFSSTKPLLFTEQKKELAPECKKNLKDKHQP